MVFENILAVHWKSLLVADGVLNGQVLLFVTPGQRERMICPQANGGHVEICMLAWSESPWASHAHGDAESITRKDLNICLCAAIANIAHHETGKADGSLEDPESKYTIEHELLGAILEMHPNST